LNFNLFIEIRPFTWLAGILQQFLKPKNKRFLYKNNILKNTLNASDDLKKSLFPFFAF